MRTAGQVALARFPTVGLTPGKARPVLLLATVPGPHGDWLVCMLSTQLHHAVEGFDEVIDPAHDDFATSGLRRASVIRVARLAVVPADLLAGALGEIGAARLQRIRERLAEWVQDA